METVQSRHQTGQSLVEFALLLALVAVIAIVGLLVFGAAVSSLLSSLSKTVAANV
jgi:Flp pilus assembly pilin Flp